MTPNMVSDPKDITSIVTWILAEAIPEAELFMLLPHLTKIPKRLQPLSPWDSDKSWHSWPFTPELKNVVFIPFIARAKPIQHLDMM